METMNEERLQKKKSGSGKRIVDKKEKRVLDIGYHRVIAIKKDKDSLSSLLKKYDSIPSASGSSSILHIFSGEKKEERYMRLRMVQYKQLLQVDLKLAEKALVYHSDRQESLQLEFKEQEMQLWRWGLDHLLRDFRMQSWSRQDRGELLIDMSKIIVSTLQSRLQEINQFIEILQTKSSKRAQSERERLESITDSYYQSPEKLLERNSKFLEKRKRLEQFDRLCHSASLKFRQLLPELNSKAYAEREAVIHQICTRYSKLLDDRQLSMDHEFTATASWGEFCQGYQERVREELSLYAEYLRFVDDEREREGRLFRRWCNLVKSTYSGDTTTAAGAFGMNGNQSSSSMNNLSKDSTNTMTTVPSEKNNNGVGSGGDKKAVEGNATYMAHPRAIQKFIRYFAINILSSYYAVPPELESALIALTDNVIYRNIHEVTFYSMISSKMKSDGHWRRQCHLGKYIDPVQYAVPPKFLGRKEQDNTVFVDDSTHSEHSTNSLVDQINHHRSSIHSLDPTDFAALAAASAASPGAKPSPEEFDNWNEDSVSNERYSEFISKSRAKNALSPQNNELLRFRFQSYDEQLAESGEAEQESTEVSGGEIEGNSEQPRRRRDSDQLDLEGEDLASRDTLLPEESLKKTHSGEHSPNMISIQENFENVSVSTETSKSEDKTKTPPVKTRPHRSPSVEKSERKKSSISGSSGRRRSGSSRFKKDSYCDSLLTAATLKSLASRLEQILLPDISLGFGQRSDGSENGHDSPKADTTVTVPYAIASRVMGLIEIAVTPREIIVCVLMSMIWLSRLANELSGRAEILGADTVFPILVNVLINANISHIHPILDYVTTYSSLESFGEAEYYMTCIIAAVEFIDSLQIPEDIRRRLRDSPGSGIRTLENEEAIEQGAEAETMIQRLDMSRGREREEQENREAAVAIQHLGEWLRDQQLMEDTMVVMMQEGWMG